MLDKDKKIVNTEEQNRAVNPGDGENQEDSISQEAAHTVNTDTSTSSRDTETTAPRNAVNDTDDSATEDRDNIEGEQPEHGRGFAEE